MDWVYKQIIGFLGNFFAEMGNMGAELFEMSWVQSIVLFFSYLAWTLYGVGLIVACAECGLEYSSGRADIKGTAMNLIKGFMAVGLFTVVPIKLYELCVSLQASFTVSLSGAGASFGSLSPISCVSSRRAGSCLSMETTRCIRPWKKRRPSSPLRWIPTWNVYKREMATCSTLPRGPRWRGAATMGYSA